jgi:hypothetical protein
MVHLVLDHARRQSLGVDLQPLAMPVLRAHLPSEVSPWISFEAIQGRLTSFCWI